MSNVSLSLPCMNCDSAALERPQVTSVYSLYTCPKCNTTQSSKYMTGLRTYEKVQSSFMSGGLAAVVSHDAGFETAFSLDALGLLRKIDEKEILEYLDRRNLPTVFINKNSFLRGFCKYCEKFAGITIDIELRT